MISQSIDDIFYALRMARNKAVHSGYDSFEDCVTLLGMAHILGVWFMQTYGDWQYMPVDFVLPEDTSKETDYQALLQEKEELIAQLTEQVKRQTPAEKISTTERVKLAASA